MDEPEIVKQLRTEEKKGLLKCETNYFDSNQEENQEIGTNFLELIENSHDSISDTIKIEDLEKN